MKSKGPVIGCVVLILMVAAVVVGVVYLAPKMVRKIQARSNINKLYNALMVYDNKYNGVPNMRKPFSKEPGSVRDLYALYRIVADKPGFLRLLQPPGAVVTPFSANPGPEEFDTKHIAYVYNPGVRLNQPKKVIVLAERGVSDGVLSDEDQPLLKDGAHFLLSNGTVIWIPVENGKLQWHTLGVTLQDLAELR